MKNTLKTLGILLIVAAAFLIASCGPPEEPEETFTVTFDSNGGTTVPAQSGIAKDGFASAPTPPTKTVPATGEGLYKNFNPSSITFDGWFLDLNDAEKYEFSTPVTADIKLIAKWNDTASKETLSGTGDIVSQAVVKVNNDNTSGATFTLFLANNVNATQKINFTKGTLTIKSTNVGQKTIKATKETVYLTVGDGSSNTTTATLTLNNIALEGCGEPVANSLATVKKGGELVLNAQSAIRNHENNIGSGTSSNAAGNGSAINVNEGTLTINTGAVIENNKSSGTQQPNRNLVGGVYGYKGKLNILGGEITGNICPYVLKDNSLGDVESNRDYQHTKDVYVTEYITLTISGYTKIGELTLNADVNSGTTVDCATIHIPSAVTNSIDKLCLRSTQPPSGTTNPDANTVLNTIKSNWTGKPILTADNSYVITADDIRRFHLGDFRGTIDFTNVAGSKIDDGFHIDSTGKLVANK